MGDLSKNFSRFEFACRGNDCCGGSAPVHPDLIKGLQALRDAVKQPLIISSGFRCRKHNKSVGGEHGSFHTLGMAADVILEGCGTMYLKLMAEGVGVFGSIGVSGLFVHVDVREGEARWTQ